MLNGIDPILGPELLYTLARMGHGDELAVVDRNYPAYSSGRDVHRLDGVNAVEAGRAILSLVPLDTFIDAPVEYMQVVGDPAARVVIHDEFGRMVNTACGRDVTMAPIERFAFYERTRHVTALVATGEDRPYGCFIITKGVLPQISPG
ncbi:RbsD/FucU family protein [soil metagenome]|jgi:L-fucose mutarotase